MIHLHLLFFRIVSLSFLETWKTNDRLISLKFRSNVLRRLADAKKYWRITVQIQLYLHFLKGHLSLNQRTNCWTVITLHISTYIFTGLKLREAKKKTIWLSSYRPLKYVILEFIFKNDLLIAFKSSSYVKNLESLTFNVEKKRSIQ